MANVVHRDLDLYFEGQMIFGNYIIFNILKKVRAIEKCSIKTFRKVDTNHPMALIRRLYVVTLTYIFKVTKFLEYI